VTGGPRGSVERFFGSLYKGISMHFAIEERYMRRHYDPLAAGRNDHERVLDEIHDISDDFTNEAQTASALAGRLEAWFSRHFETHDASLRGVGRSPALTFPNLRLPLHGRHRTNQNSEQKDAITC
jgi:hemerythrin